MNLQNLEIYSSCFKHFIQKRKRPLKIDISNKETMKISIEKAQKKVSFKLSSNSNFSVFEVGTLKMDNAKIVGNIASAIVQLKEKWPGGWLNIMRLYLKPMRQSKVSIPLYYSKINPNDVGVPVEVGVKQTRLDKLNELLALKSKKLRLDRKTKKIVKVKGQAPPKKQDKTEKKEKKRKLAEPAVKTEDAAEVETKKKKKKTSEQEVPVASQPAADETSKAKKKKKNPEADVAVEAPKEGKKKKTTEVVPAEVEAVEHKKKKNKNKKNKA